MGKRLHRLAVSTLKLSILSGGGGEYVGGRNFLERQDSENEHFGVAGCVLHCIYINLCLKHSCGTANILSSVGTSDIIVKLWVEL